MQVIRERKIYDVCIVGSGAGGGMAAKILTEAGAEVALLEASAMWDSEKDSKIFAWPYDSPAAATPDKPFGEFDGCIGGWDIPGDVAKSAHVEHWLNGIKLLEYELWIPTGKPK